MGITNERPLLRQRTGACGQEHPAPGTGKAQAQGRGFLKAPRAKSPHSVLFQERGHAVIRNALCWEELHAGLDAVGLRFVRKGSGAVIFVGDTAVKASSVDRNFGMSRLCKRLGEFKPGSYSERTFKKPAPEPVSHVCREEWQEYQKERQRLAEERHLARAKREEEREELEQRQKDRREAATARLAQHELSVLNIARHFLEGTGAGRKSGVTGQAGSIRKAGAAPALQALAGQAQSAPWQSVAFPQTDRSRCGGQKARISQSRQTDLAVCRLSGNGQKAFPRKDG